MASGGFTWVSPARPWHKEPVHTPTFTEARQRAASASYGGGDQLSPQRSPSSQQLPRTMPRAGGDPRTPPHLKVTGVDDAGETRLRFTGLSLSVGGVAEEGPDQGMPFLRPGEHTGHGVVAERARIPALSHLSVHALTDPVAPWLEVC